MSGAATQSGDQVPVEGQAVQMETEEDNGPEAHIQTLESLLVSARAAQLTAEEVAAIRALLEQNRAMKLKLNAGSTGSAGKRGRFEDDHTPWESVDGEAQEQDTAANVDGDTFEGLYGSDSEANLSSGRVRVDSPSPEALAACKYVCEELDAERLNPHSKDWQWHMLNAQHINKQERRNLWHRLRQSSSIFLWHRLRWASYHVPSVAELLEEIKQVAGEPGSRGTTSCPLGSRRTVLAPLFELPGIGGRLRQAVFHVMSQDATMAANFDTVFGASNENPKAFRWHGWSVYHQALTEEFAPDPLRTQFGRLEWSYLLRTDTRDECSHPRRGRRPDPLWLDIARQLRLMDGQTDAFSRLWRYFKMCYKGTGFFRIVTEWRGEFDEEREVLNMTLVELAKEILLRRTSAGLPPSSQLDRIIAELEDSARIRDVHTCNEDKVTHAENLTSLGIIVDASLQVWIKAVMVELPEFRTLVEHRRIMPALLNKVTGYDQFFEHPRWKEGLADAMRREHENSGYSFEYRSTFYDAVRFSSNMDKHPNKAFMWFFCAQFQKPEAEVQKRTQQLKAMYYCFLRTGTNGDGVAPNILDDIRKVRAESKRRIRVLGWGDLHYAVWVAGGAASVGDVATSILAGDDASKLDHGGAVEELRELAERHAVGRDKYKIGEGHLSSTVQRSPRDWNELVLKLLNEKPQKTEEDVRELEARVQIRELLGPCGKWEARKIQNAEWYASEKKLATIESDEILRAEVAAVVDAEKAALRRLENEKENLVRKKDKNDWQRQQTQEKIARLEGVSAAEARAYFWEQLPQDQRAELRKQKTAATASSSSSATSCSVPENADVSSVSTTGASSASDAALSLETSPAEDESRARNSSAARPRSLKKKD